MSFDAFLPEARRRTVAKQLSLTDTQIPREENEPIGGK